MTEEKTVMWAAFRGALEKLADLPSVGSAPYPQMPTLAPQQPVGFSGAAPTSQYRSQSALGGNFMARYRRSGVATPTAPARPAA